MDIIPLLIPIIAILGGFSVVLFNIHQRGRARELRYRERMAMIERGITPPPEPAIGWMDDPLGGSQRGHHGRHGSAGIVLVGVGFGLMLIIAFAGHRPDVGFGVGGALVVLGIAFFINSRFCCRPDAGTSESKPPVPRPGASSDEPRPLP